MMTTMTPDRHWQRSPIYRATMATLIIFGVTMGAAFGRGDDAGLTMEIGLAILVGGGLVVALLLATRRRTS
jgi:hypothetical protein